MSGLRGGARRPARASALTIAATVAFLCTLAYSGMKVAMALRGELGLPGFPPSDDAPVDREGIAADEWTLAALGFVAALIALGAGLPWTRRLPRWLVAVAVWAAALSQVAGAAGMTLRALRILPDLGAGPQGPVTWIVLAVLDVGAFAWLALAVLVTLARGS